jgi:uncharacterized protein YsxB (DUF464 family)
LRVSTASADSPVLRIRITLSPEGLLSRFEAEGHAGKTARGTNIACAGVTTLLRTAGRICAARGILSAGAAGEPGDMSLFVDPAADGEWLRGVTDFLLQGVKDLQREFPGEIALRVETTEV